jgi:uncharacterized membrane protein
MPDHVAPTIVVVHDDDGARWTRGRSRSPAAAHGTIRRMHRTHRRWPPLVALLAGSGVLHLVRPGPFASIVPRALGDPLPWVYGSGVSELACAAGLLARRTRRGAALATAALFVAVYPANLQMALAAVRSPTAATGYRVATLARLPLQLPLVLWALSVRRAAGRP